MDVDFIPIFAQLNKNLSTLKISFLISFSSELVLKQYYIDISLVLLMV